MLEKPKRKKFRQETIIHSYVVRPLAQEIVLLVWNTNITPNQLTLIRSIFSLIYLYLFSIGNDISFIIGVVLFQISEVIDHADGMLARMKNQTSKLGQYYEYITDELFSSEHGLLGLMISYGVYLYTSNIIFIYLSILTMFFYYFTQYIKVTINSDEITSKMELNHDKDEMIEIVGIPLKNAVFNLIKTFYIWKNQLFMVSLIYLIVYDEFLLLLSFSLFTVLNLLKLFRQLKTGFIRNKE